ncbi:TIGR03619 family F420-dependent LLM class oxidoreductase [Jatrophihabitans sp. YIM 134969]
MTTVGLCVPQLGAHVDRVVLRDFAQSAEALGFGSLWVQEHLFYPLRPRSGYSNIPGHPIPDPYRSTLAATETLSAVAAWTDRVLVGTSVLVAGYHRPVPLAQRLATVDLLSGGRLVAGFSVGWSDEEHELTGADPRTRGRRSQELIEALVACWGPDPVEFHGEFFDIPASVVRPKPVQRPRPLLLSGMRSVAGLARTVRQYDIWNPSRGTAAEVAATAAALAADRPEGLAPLQVYRRVFLQASVPTPSTEPPGLAGVVDEIRATRQHGLAAVVVEPNFWREIGSAADWVTVPARLAAACADAGVTLV